MVILKKGVLEMRKRGKVFVLTGSIVAMLIAGTGCSKKNTGIKNEKLASDYMELFNMSEGIKTEEGCFKIRDDICYYVDFGEEKAIPLWNAGIYRKQKILIQNVMR